MHKPMVAIALALSFSLSACDNLNPQMLVGVGSSLYSAATLSDQEIQSLGVQSAHNLDAKQRIASDNSPYTKRLNKITAPLKHYNGRSLHFKIYETPEVNAFALPNGDIRVFTGLMDKMNDDELLWVIGHEIGHVMLGHSKQAARRQLLMRATRLAMGGNSLLGSLSQGQIGDIAESFVTAQYSQTQEYEADAYGLRILKANHKSKQAAITALQKLQALGSSSSLFASHPAAAARAQRIQAMPD
ncbi:M48 family metalloprotease [Brackiella oedipodis]|uniref:M48 family metalloprotease n=1 Tax=Brackiella oedipodis TaxID=124225 RepID=UPI00048FE015|nr:M48 family metalloprotease [Brackiella oedipodis]